ncbi:MAG: cell division protein [Rhodospirillaceae bacterium]|nr:cell division protein [Rhodospirillaceae bacterium]
MRSDLPTPRQSTMGHFIAGIVAVLVFISGIAVSAAGSIGGLLDTWNASVTGTLTVQVPGEAKAADKLAESVRDALLKTEGVKRAGVVPRAQAQALLRPWLGDAKLIADLPLPALVDVELAAPSTLTLERVDAAVKAVAPAAIIDDHRVWLNRIAEFAQALGYIAFILIGLALAALTLTVVFATRASLTEYTQTIEVLHLVGARDGYIASQFSWRAVRQALWGGVIGLLAFAPTLLALSWFARRIDPGVLPPISLPLPYWGGLAALPVAAAVIAFVAARATVARALRAMV